LKILLFHNELTVQSLLLNKQLFNNKRSETAMPSELKKKNF